MFVLHREESRGCQIRQKWYRLRQPVAVLREPPRRGRRWPPHGVRGPPPAPRWATSLRTAMGYPGCFSPSERSRHDLFDSESARTLTRGPLGAGSSVGAAEGRPCGAAPHPTLGSLASVSPLYAGAPVKTRPRPTVPGSTPAGRHLESQDCSRRMGHPARRPRRLPWRPRPSRTPPRSLALRSALRSGQAPGRLQPSNHHHPGRPRSSLGVATATSCPVPLLRLRPSKPQQQQH